MKIIPASYEIIDDLDSDFILKKIERCGRLCYKSEDYTTEDSHERFVKMLINRGHLSVLEHFSFSVHFIIDRGISHEFVRHRIASYSQESTRYCNYDSKDIVFIEPEFFTKEQYLIWINSVEDSERTYHDLIKAGATPEKARLVLDHSVKTELIQTMNLREWIHFLTVRTAKDAHPQAREVAIPLLRELQSKIKIIFDHIEVEE